MMRLVRWPEGNRSPSHVHQAENDVSDQCPFCTFGCALAGTPSQNRATQAENRQVYEIYQKYMQSLNEEREMSGLPPSPSGLMKIGRNRPALIRENQAPRLVGELMAWVE